MHNTITCYNTLLYSALCYTCFDKMMPFRSMFYRITGRLLTNRVTGDSHFPKNTAIFPRTMNTIATISWQIVFIAAKSEQFIGLESRG